MALHALRRGAAASVQRGVLRCLSQNQKVAAAPVIRAVSSGMALGAEPTSPMWTMWSRAASAVRETSRDSDGALISVLKSELEHERKTYNQEKELSKGPPKPWTLTDKRGHADVILRRSFGLEDIAVTCVYQPDMYGDDQDQEQDAYSGDEADAADSGGASVNMTITVTKGSGSPTLEISAASYGTQLVIDHVHFYEIKDPKDATYEGPNFLQLDEEVQKQFERFIKARGVNKELTGYLFNILADKEQREYVRWLEKVEGFLRQ